jgi:hypothetical protein
MIYQANLNLAREAAEKLNAALLAVQALIDREPQEFPSRERITELRRISRELAKCEATLDMLFQ